MHVHIDAPDLPESDPQRIRWQHAHPHEGSHKHEDAMTVVGWGGYPVEGEALETEAGDVSPSERTFRAIGFVFKGVR